MDKKISLGISSCLLGNAVRFDGGHQNDSFVTGTLSQYAHFTPVCPEVECGLPVPREAMRLVKREKEIFLVGRSSGYDFTPQMKNWLSGRLDALAAQKLDGFIFKRMSPSSGMERVKVYRENGQVEKNGVGIFAQAFMERFPHLPVEEDGRLNDPALRENFIQRIFIFQRWQKLLKTQKNPGGLVQFHTNHKLSLLAHSETEYRHLGKLVAQAGKLGEEAWQEYEATLMQALSRRATVKSHTNVLLHIFGYFKKNLATDEKAEVLEVLGDYRHGYTPLIVPITLLKHFARKYRQEYLQQQHYLNPHPLKLKLLNHA